MKESKNDSKESWVTWMSFVKSTLYFQFDLEIQYEKLYHYNIYQFHVTKENSETLLPSVQLDIICNYFKPKLNIRYFSKQRKNYRCDILYSIVTYT